METRARERQRTLTKAEVDDLLTRAWTELVGAKDAILHLGKTTTEARSRAAIFAKQVLEIDASNAAAHELMGTILYEDKQYELALIEYRKALSAMVNAGPAKHVASLHTAIGWVLDDLGKTDEAINEYRQAVLLEPNNAESHQWLGGKLSDVGKTAEAVQELRTAIRLAPDRADFHITLGEALRSVDMDATIQEFRTAIRLNPNDAEFHKLLGSAVLAKGDHKGAISEYHQAAHLKPTEAAITHWQLGRILQYHRDTQGAIREYRKSLELDPNSENATYDLAIALADSGNWEQAFSQFRQLPGNRKAWEPLVYYRFGGILQTKGAQIHAARAYKEVLKLTPESPDTMWLIEGAQERLAKLNR